MSGGYLFAGGNEKAPALCPEPALHIWKNLWTKRVFQKASNETTPGGRVQAMLVPVSSLLSVKHSYDPSSAWNKETSVTAVAIFCTTESI